MTRRDAILRLVDVARLSLLEVRVQLGRPLPAALAGLLVWLDRVAARTDRGRA
jgi:hypothetical protein